ncbi:hypothetical protein V5O48_019516, partial [Marasmius crinis-equi]
SSIPASGVVTQGKRRIGPASRVEPRLGVSSTREPPIHHPVPDTAVARKLLPQPAPGARPTPQTSLSVSRHTTGEPPASRRGFTPDFSNLQAEMQEYQENEDRRWQAQQALDEAEHRRVLALDPGISDEFSWDWQDSGVEPPNKKRKYDNSDDQRPKRPLPSRIRETPRPGNSPVAGPSGLQPQNGGGNRPRATLAGLNPSPSRPKTP